jgi:hypothetical protein
MWLQDRTLLGPFLVAGQCHWIRVTGSQPVKVFCISSLRRLPPLAKRKSRRRAAHALPVVVSAAISPHFIALGSNLRLLTQRETSNRRLAF